MEINEVIGSNENSYFIFQLWTPLNIILFNLVCSDFSVSVFGNPFALLSALSHGWMFGSVMCQIYGFFMSLLGGYNDIHIFSWYSKSLFQFFVHNNAEIIYTWMLPSMFKENGMRWCFMDLKYFEICHVAASWEKYYQLWYSEWNTLYFLLLSDPSILCGYFYIIYFHIYLQ